MKGIILAGGLGTRLRPITYIVNKNILPIYNKPAIFYSIELFSNSGIKDIAIVAENEFIDDFKKLLGEGADFGVKLTYFIDSPLKKGPVSALLHARNFANTENVAVVFADNVFDISIKDQVSDFTAGAHFFFKEVDNPKSFGVAHLDKNRKLIDIEEKPAKPKTNLASMGLYLFDKDLYTFLERVEPSINGEYLMPTVSNYYIKEKEVSYTIFKGFWEDMGTFDGLYNASRYFYNKHKKIERYKNRIIKNDINYLESLG